MVEGEIKKCISQIPKFYSAYFTTRLVNTLLLKCLNQREFLNKINLLNLIMSLF